MRISDWSSDVCSSDLNRVAVDEQRGLAETQLAELALKRLGLGVLQFQRVEHDQLAVLRLCRQGVLQAQNAHLLVERLLERAGPGAVRLAAADEDRRATIAVTGGTATLLATELLAGAGDVGPFA